MKKARLKNDAKNKTIKRLLESPQVREKYSIFMVVRHFLLNTYAVFSFFFFFANVKMYELIT